MPRTVAATTVRPAPDAMNYPGQMRPRRPGLAAPRPLRTPAPRLAGGGVRPESSSREGRLEELPELCESKCSTRASLPANTSLASISSASSRPLAEDEGADNLNLRQLD
jgi:hypothetical protein